MKVLRPSADGTGVASSSHSSSGLTQPYGIQFYPAGGQPQWVYISEINRVMRYPYKVGDTKSNGTAESWSRSSPDRQGGTTRATSRSRWTASTCSSPSAHCRTCGRQPEEDAAEIKAWEAEHGLGAAWGDEANRADVLVFEVGSNQPGKPFATGIGDCVALVVQPGSGDLWCTVNERDALGDNLVPDYSTRVKEGGFYGWPWSSGGSRRPAARG